MSHEYKSVLLSKRIYILSLFWEHSFISFKSLQIFVNQIIWKGHTHSRYIVTVYKKWFEKSINFFWRERMDSLMAFENKCETGPPMQNLERNEGMEMKDEDANWWLNGGLSLLNDDLWASQIKDTRSHETCTSIQFVNYGIY